jgi:hypothetical protein
MPCADMEADNSAHNNTEFASNHDKDSHNKSNDLCSPFCICSCCGSQIANYSQSIIISFPILSKSIQTQLPTYQSVLTSNFYGSIWQPPKLV